MPKRKPGEGRKGPFTKEQNDVIEDSYMAWHNYAFVENPEHEGQGVSGKLTVWKQREAKEILKDPAFKVLPAGLNYTQTLKAVVRKFTNYRNARKKLLDDRTREIKALQDAAAAFADLKSGTSGRDLFKEQMHSEIVSRRTMIMLGNPDISKVGAYAKALAELWAEANQELWQSKAANIAKDIYKNREHLEQALYLCLRGLCQGGELGNIEILMLVASRDNTGRVATSLFEAHHDDQVTAYSKSVEKKEADRLRLSYEWWAEAILPEERPCAEDNSTHLEQDSSGLPLFPSINLDKESLESIRQILQSYLEHNWDHCNPRHPDIPWEEIASRPSAYYDLEAFSMDALIDHPSNLTNAELFALVSELLKHSGSDSVSPFRFKTVPSSARRRTPVKDDDTESTISSRPPPATEVAVSERARSPTGSNSDSELSRSPSPIGTERSDSSSCPHLARFSPEVLPPTPAIGRAQTSPPLRDTSEKDSPERSPSLASDRDRPRSRTPENPTHDNDDIPGEFNRQPTPSSILADGEEPFSPNPPNATQPSVSPSPEHHHDAPHPQHPGEGGHTPPPSLSQHLSPVSPLAIKEASPPITSTPRNLSNSHTSSSPQPLSREIGARSSPHPTQITSAHKEQQFCEQASFPSAPCAVSFSAGSSSAPLERGENAAEDATVPGGGEDNGGTTKSRRMGERESDENGGGSGEIKKRGGKNGTCIKGGRGRSNTGKQTKANGTRTTGGGGSDGTEKEKRNVGRVTRSTAVGNDETSNRQGRKRPRSYSESEDIYDHKVRLLDGRRGIFTRDKHFKGGYFHEEGKDGSEWMNDPWGRVQMPSLI